MNERIKLIRKEEGLSQDDFGKHIGIGKTSVSKLESGENNPSERTVKLICSEFNINEEWLRTGKGNMKEELPVEDEYFKAAAQISKNQDSLAMKALVEYWKLDDESKKIFRDYLQNVFEKSRD